MSFYGSVYYQLIDTFSKVIAKNKSSNDFLESIKEEDHILASGRQGEIKFKNGNNWINFSIDPNENDIMVWHSRPDDSTKNLVMVDSGEDKPNAIQLNYEDCFGAVNFSYDAAGHIVGEPTISYFRLPKLPETAANVERLNEIVGQTAVESENGEATGLCLTQEQNDDLYKFYGGKDMKYNIFGYSSNNESFPKAFGRIDKLREKFKDGNNKSTVCEILEKFKDDNDAENVTMTSAFAGLEARVAALEALVSSTKE